MIDVSFEREFEFDAETVWGIFADFGNVSWVPGVEKVEVEGEGIGMVRHLTVQVFPPLHERLESRSHEDRVLEYSIPSVEYLEVANYRARAQVTGAGDGHCRVRMTCRAEATGLEADAAAKVEAFYGAMLGWIDDYLRQ
jgi:carbon monoxide dehydrogenase subunit G